MCEACLYRPTGQLWKAKHWGRGRKKLWDVEGLATVSLCDTSPDGENGTPPWTRTTGARLAARRVWSGIQIMRSAGSVSTSLEPQEYNRSHEADGWAPRRVLDASMELSGPKNVKW